MVCFTDVKALSFHITHLHCDASAHYVPLAQVWHRLNDTYKVSLYDGCGPPPTAAKVYSAPFRHREEPGARSSS